MLAKKDKHSRSVSHVRGEDVELARLICSADALGQELRDWLDAAAKMNRVKSDGEIRNIILGVAY